ncbi:MAG: [FeFe] hydrogenase, group A [Clostridiales Family XIII bacterium]|jgi:NADH-quinone oxidoreductase subunit G|nr:[FeFe] hydrogenase, group A [Clostridiales Family XIII bacterium]
MMEKQKQKSMVINGMLVPFTDEPNVLDVVRKAGIDLPTFCYYSDLSTYGACRMCIVEDNRGNIFASCSEVPRDGMEIRTHTPKLQSHRKNILRLLLASHCRECTTCAKNIDCRLQELARRFGIHMIKYDKSEKAYKEFYRIDESSPSIVRDSNKCIVCGDCVRMCSEKQNVGCIDFTHRGWDMMVGTAFDMPLAETDCVGCGQCAAVCPTGAIVVKDDTKKIWESIYDPNKKVIVQIAPAVRFAFGEAFGLAEGENTMPLIVAALRRIGFDEVYDTSFAADLTVMEESAEFLEHVEGGHDYPLFTSCCPAWVKYAENRWPQILPHVSTCKSPMQMFGSVIKENERVNRADGREVVTVAVMPCTAKKGEILRPEFERDGMRDTDYVITTIEIANMVWEAGIEIGELEPAASDMVFGLYSGGGLIFGVTGGVTEAVIRRVAADKSHSGIENIRYTGVRGLEGIKAFELPFGDRTLRIGVVSGLQNAETLIQRIESGEEHFDFIEVMTCPSGCINGGGQPFSHSFEKEQRATGVYKSDKLTAIRSSDMNPAVRFAYREIIKDKAHDMLHVPVRK